MTAAQIMTKPALTTSPRALVKDIARDMVANRISGVPVVGDDGELVGIVTEADLLRAHGEGRELARLKVADLMTEQVVSVDVETSVDDLVIGLQVEEIMRVPVTENGVLVGVVSRGDLLRALLEPEL